MAPLKIIDHSAFGETIFSEEQIKMSKGEDKAIEWSHSDYFN
ncbi:MAG: hypothetical protein Q8L64_01670 [bacterium]|nr:hypothetical protein [bacterium]